MMYSVRKTTIYHGNANFYVLLFILLLTSLLIINFGKNYLIIFLSSGLLHVILETAVTLTGVRKGHGYLFGKKLHRAPEILLRSFVEGPALCVPAFFVADQYIQGNTALAFVGSTTIVGLASLYLAVSDNVQLKKAGKEGEMISRRAMTNPKSVMLLALLNTFCLSMLFLIPLESRGLAFMYLLAYSTFVLSFYFINYNFGVRYVEIYDPETKEYRKPGALMQAAGLSYDSVYEMALLISSAFWVPFYLGLFEF
jgi:hypothetical protein